MKRCFVSKCDRPHHGRGYCQLHLTRLRDNGDVAADRPSELDWEAKYDVDPETGCWNWNRKLNVNGYSSTNAHRYMWIRRNGPVPKGLWIDHLCRNRKCVNPGHMEAVTPAENVHRGTTPRFCWDDVRNIRKLARDGVKRSLIAKMYQTGRGHIRNITIRKTWKVDPCAT